MGLNILDILIKVESANVRTLILLETAITELLIHVQKTIREREEEAEQHGLDQ